MADAFFTLSRADQREALLTVAARSGRPAHLLEKDLYVVWLLRTLFNAPFGTDLTFDGGTSLSKAYKPISVSRKTSISRTTSAQSPAI